MHQIVHVFLYDNTRTKTYDIKISQVLSTDLIDEWEHKPFGNFLRFYQITNLIR